MQAPQLRSPVYQARDVGNSKNVRFASVKSSKLQVELWPLRGRVPYHLHNLPASLSSNGMNLL